eukprot:TRINITY_DN846_c0_g1_i13.p1 TRINITY_DN846_c0_g1~~TRINITY_DN846_c0_g1_i13.p1  ORF type:complete len:315 (+),score=84.34 TRINITY_DN846_c0_g1_i13:365-1309(+)
MSSAYEYPFWNDANIDVDLEELTAIASPATAALGKSVLVNGSTMHSFEPMAMQTADDPLVQGSLHANQVVPGMMPLLQQAAAVQDPAVLKSLTSELESIRNSINELKRNQHQESAQVTDARRTALLSDAIGHLANARTAPPPCSKLQPAMPVKPVFDVDTFTAQQKLMASQEPAVVPSSDGPSCGASRGSNLVSQGIHKQRDLDPQTKKLVRKQRNRQAAQNSRLRKKMRLEALEENLRAVMEDNHKYQIACEELTRRNSILEEKLRRIFLQRQQQQDAVTAVSASVPSEEFPAAFVASGLESAPSGQADRPLA